MFASPNHLLADPMEMAMSLSSGADLMSVSPADKLSLNLSEQVTWKDEFISLWHKHYNRAAAATEVVGLRILTEIPETFIKSRLDCLAMTSESRADPPRLQVHQGHASIEASRPEEGFGLQVP